jgi:hypothetical protein
VYKKILGCEPKIACWPATHPFDGFNLTLGLTEAQEVLKPGFFVIRRWRPTPTPSGSVWSHLLCTPVDSSEQAQWHCSTADDIKAINILNQIDKMDARHPGFREAYDRTARSQKST